jgi:hypothetical protein
LASQVPTSRDKVRNHRARLRMRGMRPIQLWVPDVRSSTFVAEAHRQSLLISNSEQDDDDQVFVDSISEFWDMPE